MAELRWTLLVLGLLFLAALAWWELRRSGRARRDAPHPPLQQREPAPEFPRHREPTLTLPDLPQREPVREPPVMEIADDSMIGLRIDGRRIDDEIGPIRDEPLPLPPPSDAGEIAEPRAGEAGGPEPAPLLADIPEAPPDPIVDWPEDEAERRILAIRIASRREERFAGHAVRQAVAAEGFVHGKFSIFHLPARDGRVAVSITSLTKPGSFDLASIDTQRFVGLSLFAVLPGPLAPDQALEVLLDAARSLNERLDGALQDERGQPLTAEKIAELRASVAPP